MTTQTPPSENGWSDWMPIGLGLVALVTIIAAIVATVALARSDSGGERVVPAAAVAAETHAHAPATAAAAPTVADAKGVDFEKFESVDPKLPAPPPGRSTSRSSTARPRP